MNRIGLFLRGALPLLLVAAAMVGGPTLLAWWLLGGPLGWQHLLLGLLGGAGLLLVGGLIFGWALGRRRSAGRGE
jgi:hypothetical protein